MSVWRHLLDRIMGPSIREAYLRGYADGKALNRNRPPRPQQGGNTP